MPCRTITLVRCVGHVSGMAYGGTWDRVGGGRSGAGYIMYNQPQGNSEEKNESPLNTKHREGGIMYQTKVWYDVICDDCHEIKATRVLESEIEETLKNHKFCVWCNRNVSLEVNRYSEYKEGDVRDDR